MTDKSETAQPSGLPYAMSAYLIWGFVPVYFKLLSHVSPVAVVAQRVLWSIPLLLVIMAFRKQLGEYAAIFRHKAHLRNLLASATLVAINWLIYIWAVSTDHILAVSLGYYLNPLVNVLLGRLFLGERLRPLQMVAVAVAAIAFGNPINQLLAPVRHRLDSSRTQVDRTHVDNAVGARGVGAAINRYAATWTWTRHNGERSGGVDIFPVRSGKRPEGEALSDILLVFGVDVLRQFSCSFAEQVQPL